MWKLALASLLLLTLSACNFFAPPAPDQTRSAEFALVSTQMVGIRATASADANWLLATQEAIQTAVRDVEAQSTRTSATIVALGTPFIDVSNITPAAVSAVSGGQALPTMIQVTPGGAALGSVTALGTPTPLPPTAVALNPSGPGLINITLSTSVGADDCAAAPAASFPTGVGGVYVVATAINLGPQNVITYRWQRDSIEVWVDTWSPGGPTNGACIWYYLTPNQTELTPGAWAVEILIDGQMISTPATFTITP